MVDGEIGIVPEVHGRPVAPAGSRVVMSFPDVLGRLVQPDPDHVLIAVVDRMVGGTVEIDRRHRRIDVGRSLGDPGALVAALAHVGRRVMTAGGVRPVASAPYAIPLVGPTVPDDLPTWCDLDRPALPGLPDLVVVRPVDDPRWRGRRRPPPRLTVR